jgi:hypothetical protein
MRLAPSLRMPEKALVLKRVDGELQAQDGKQPPRPPNAFTSTDQHNKGYKHPLKLLRMPKNSITDTYLPCLAAGVEAGRRGIASLPPHPPNAFTSTGWHKEGILA